MRILLVANYEPDGQESMKLYAAWLERTLKARGHEVTVARPKAFFSRLAWNFKLKKYSGYWRHLFYRDYLTYVAHLPLRPSRFCTSGRLSGRARAKSGHGQHTSRR